MGQIAHRGDGVELRRVRRAQPTVLDTSNRAQTRWNMDTFSDSSITKRYLTLDGLFIRRFRQDLSRILPLLARVQ
ncbi:MAG: hypothetical protein ACRDS0_13105 [Pseudonocardiaceae bacterium]